MRIEIGHELEPEEKRHLEDTFLRFSAMQLRNFEMEDEMRGYLSF